MSSIRSIFKSYDQLDSPAGDPEEFATETGNMPEATAAGLQDEDSASDIQRFIICECPPDSPLEVSDLLVTYQRHIYGYNIIDWLGTYLLDLLGTFDFPSLSPSLVSQKKN